jgi:hypothetical protein
VFKAPTAAKPAPGPVVNAGEDWLGSDVDPAEFHKDFKGTAPRMTPAQAESLTQLLNLRPAN